jgi:AraC-like DNA-binding protein
MPVFMDLHIARGVTARQLAEAHLLDVRIQDAYSCKAMTYWMDEDKGCVFCLIEAPDKESVRELHARSHGLIPNEIIEVNIDVVKSFLGRIHDPLDVVPDPDTNLKVFTDPAFRILLLAKTTDSKLLQHKLGKSRAEELLLLFSTILKDEARDHGGAEVYRRDAGFVVAFTTHRKAMDCALALKKKLQSSADHIGLKIALHGGVPVDNDEEIFGSTIRFLQFLTSISSNGQIVMSSVVRDLFKGNDWTLSVGHGDTRSLNATENSFLQTLHSTLALRWQNPEFDMVEFCEVMSVSKSQLYRKCIATTGMSPNSLLREYRLVKSLELLRNEDRNISETTFETGFSSPSYFTKCFQKRFGIAPNAYAKAKF